MERKSNFKGYQVVYTDKAERDLGRIDARFAQKIYKKFDELVQGKPNIDIIKMQGNNDDYRLRYGDYRAIFQVKKDVIIILVIKVGHRGEVY